MSVSAGFKVSQFYRFKSEPGRTRAELCGVSQAGVQRRVSVRIVGDADFERSGHSTTRPRGLVEEEQWKATDVSHPF